MQLETTLEVVHGRTNHLIDPGLHIWGWEIPVYLFLGGLVAGLMIVLAALELRRGGQAPSPRLAWMPWIALALLSLGMGALFLDLEHKLHVWRFYATFEPTSPMSWGSWLLLLVYPALALLGLGSLSEGQRDRLRTRIRGGWWFGKIVAGALTSALAHRRAVLWTTLVLGAGLGAYTGVLLGTLNARLLWSSALLGPLFLVSGVSTGAALLLLARPTPDEQHALVRWDIAAIGVELFLLLLLVLGHATGGAGSRVAADLLLGGAWTPWFWSLLVIGGLLVPLTLELVEVRRRLPMTLMAPALVLVGGFALRAILVAAGQETSFALGMLP